MSIDSETFQNKAKDLWQRFLKIDWNNPLNLLILTTVVIAPFVAKLYVMTGLLLGLLLTISTLWTLTKCPLWVRKQVVKHHVIADFVLSMLAMIGVGSLFGSGLTLGIGAVICGILLGYCLPFILSKEEREQTVTI